MNKKEAIFCQIASYYLVFYHKSCIFVVPKKNTMTKVSFKSEPYKFLTLFPENIFDKLDSNHPAKLVEMVVNQLDITDIIKNIRVEAVLHTTLVQ